MMLMPRDFNEVPGVDVYRAGKNAVALRPQKVVNAERKLTPTRLGWGRQSKTDHLAVVLLA